MSAVIATAEPRVLILYSSVTGNTRRVAEALAAASGDRLLDVRKLETPPDADVLALGFWVRRGQPDEFSQSVWRSLKGRSVFYFGTLGAWPSSEQARRCWEEAERLLRENGNRCLGGFLCQGRVNPRLIELSARKGTHPLTEERRARLAEAARHPDASDCAAAAEAWLAARSAALREASEISGMGCRNLAEAPA